MDEQGRRHRRGSLDWWTIKLREAFPRETMQFDDIVAELGEFGPYQKRLYYLTCLVAIPAALQTLGGVFTMATPDHRCALPGLDNDTYKSQGPWHKELIEKSVPWDEDEEDYSSCDLNSFNITSGVSNNRTYSCSKYVFSEEIVDNTFTREVEMICGDKSMSTYANMIYMGGLLAGSLILGTLSDVIGRKKVMLIGILGHFITSFSVAFVTSYVPFVIIRFLTACFGMGMFLSAFVIGMEIVGPSKRKFAGMVIEFFWCIGLFILVFLAYFIRTWKYLQIATSIPTVFLLSLAFLMPESPRWLINKGRYEEATKIIQKAAEVNGVKLSDHLTKFEKLEDDEPGEKIWGMFTTPTLAIRCLVIFYNWLVSSLVYYGLSLNVGALSGDIYLNFTLSSVVEVVGYAFCIALLDRFGRKPMHCFSMLVAGFACLGTMFPVMFGDESVEWITIALSLIGKFGASAAFAIIYIFSAELFPTAMRNSGMGLSSFAARIGGISAPYIADLKKVVTGDMGVALPLVIFGGASVLAGLLSLLLPETMGKVLPESVEDAKNFGRKDKKNAYELNAKETDSSYKSGNINSAYSPDN